MSKKTIIIISVVVNLILLSLVIYYEKEDKRYISNLREKDNISMLKIVGEDTEVIKQVPQTGSWFMSYTCDDENAQLYWNEKKRTVVAKNISATECTLIFRENTSAFSLVSMYVNGDYVTKLDDSKFYRIESYNCSNGEELTWDIKTNTLLITPILENTSCDVNFIEARYLSLSEQIIKDNKVQTDVNINFENTSQIDGTKGLYYTSDLSKTQNRVPVYYYRGAVENNYVVFGGFCWRIVRTVEDGSVRLRYGGAATQSGETYTCPQTGTAVNISSSQQYYKSYNNKSYVNYRTSSIRTTVENWYRDNIYKGGTNTAVTSLIADTPYCNDMSERIENSSIYYFGSYDRLVASKSPQFNCSSLTHMYTVENGSLTYPIALLTADEVAYAGGGYDLENTSYYLYTGESYWTMSPYNFGGVYAWVWLNVSNGELFYGTVSNPASVLPVISLKSEAIVDFGSGLYNDPYVIWVE